MIQQDYRITREYVLNAMKALLLFILSDYEHIVESKGGSGL